MISASLANIARISIAVMGIFALGATPVQKHPDLQGKITIEQLYDAFPVFKETAKSYRPDPSSLRAIGWISLQTRIVAFLGTWCLDSQSEIPALLKTLEMAHNPNLSLELYAVDRDIDDGGGMADRFGVNGVPTVIFFRNSRELGRIKGLAKKSMEEDLFHIIGTETKRK